MKKFEPHYRLVRIGAAQKIEKASRQQRTWASFPLMLGVHGRRTLLVYGLQLLTQVCRETTEEQIEGV